MSKFTEDSEARGADYLDKKINDLTAISDNNISPKQSVNLLKASDIEIEPITWLWPGWLAAGKIHILGGAPGTGKTTIAMAFAATISTGGAWPDGTNAKAGNVVIWSGEDDPADTLAPRLLSSGADLSRIYFISGVGDGVERRSFDPAVDIDKLKNKLVKIGGARLLVVDPIVSAISGDSHKNSEVRRGLQPLDDLAKSMRCAVLGITHFTKGTGGRDPVERLNGSLAFGALARIVMVAVKHQEEDEDGCNTRLLLRAKSNIGADDGGYEYALKQEELRTHQGVIASCTSWGKTVEGTARELLATAEALPEDENNEAGSAVDWLRQLLIDEDGEIDRRDVMKAANAMGYKERTVHRARLKLNLTVKQNGFGKEKRSLWALSNEPNHANNSSIVPIMPTIFTGTHGTNGEKSSDYAEVEI